MTEENTISEQMAADMAEIAVLARKAQRKGCDFPELEKIEETAEMWL